MIVVNGGTVANQVVRQFWDEFSQRSATALWERIEAIESAKLIRAHFSFVQSFDMPFLATFERQTRGFLEECWKAWEKSLNGLALLIA